MALTNPGGGGGEKLDLSRKLGPLPVWAWAGLGVAIALFWSKKKGSSSSSSSQMGSSTGYSTLAQEQAAALAGAGYGGLFPTGYSDYSSGQDLASVLSSLSTQITALGGGKTGTSTSPTPTPGGKKGPSVFNPYPVGTEVAKNEKIVQVIPVGTRGYIDVTSLGGLYGVGVNVSGSAYNPSNKGSFSAAVSGNKVYEYTPTGVKVYALK